MGNYIEYNDTIAFHPGYYIKELVAIPDVMEKFLADKDECQYAASKIMNADSLLYIGRGLDYALSMEGAFIRRLMRQAS